MAVFLLGDPSTDGELMLDRQGLLFDPGQHVKKKEIVGRASLGIMIANAIAKRRSKRRLDRRLVSQELIVGLIKREKRTAHNNKVLKDTTARPTDSFSKRKEKEDDRAFILFLVLDLMSSFSLLERNHLPTIRMKTYDRSRSFSFSREIFLVSISWLGQRPLLRASQRTQESQHNKRKRRKQTFDRISDRLFSFFF